MDILYVGHDGGSSRHRARALRRLGHRVQVVDPWRFLPARRWLGHWTWRTGTLFLATYLRRRVLAAVPPGRWSLGWVDSGELVGPGLVRALQRRCGRVVNYNLDDPFGPRDGRRWRLHLRAVPCYDLLVVHRAVNVAEAYARGAQRVLRVYRSADEEAHAPRSLTDADRSLWADTVLFVGTWMPERGPFLVELLERGVPLAIRGDGWSKAREWPALRAAWRGPSLYDAEYAKALGGAALCLGLLSKGNRDLHTQRSMEIPFAGGLLCAERTSEHSQLYREGDEAVFWDDAAECAARWRELARAPAWRAQVAAHGRARCVANGHLNERVMDRVLCAARQG